MLVKKESRVEDIVMEMGQGFDGQRWSFTFTANITWVYVANIEFLLYHILII